MKKARAARDRGAPKRAALPPPLPPFEELDALAAAATPTVEAAWWITHQVSEHVFSMVARIDPRTGEPLPRPLTEILRDVRNATATGSRPFPRDRLLGAAEFTFDSLEHLLDRHRHRIVRGHEQLPFHRLREVDTRSMAWLARQPGRNIREKLSGRTHALGVRRDVSADTAENRLLRSFARLLARRANDRLSFTGAYDGTTADAERARRLEDCVRLCDERMRRTELADVPTLTRLQPNNALLSDPHYARVFRAWKWLRDDEEALRGSWNDALQRARILLCWMVAAQLALRERVVIAETLGRVRVGRDDDRRLGVEALGGEGAEADWYLNPPLHFVVLPVGHDDAVFRVRMSLEGEFILAHVATLGGRGLLAEESVSAIAFEVRATAERLQAQRGVGIAVDGLDISLRGAERAFADLAGLAPLATQMARQILQRCGADPDAQKADRVAVRVADGARLGIEFGDASLHVSAEEALPVSTSPWALALDLPGATGGFEWLEGREEREIFVGAARRSLWATGDMVEGDEQADAGMLALAADRMLGSLASELAAPADARVAYTVPDAVDEFSQRGLRSALGASFHRPVPVWRSVAAAMAWAASAGDRAPRSGESVVVVDTEFGDVVLTVLTARYDEKLARTHPASGGLYWERKPPLPRDEQLEMLGWPHVLRAYARRLVERDLAGLTPERKERIVDDLVRSGKVSSLVRRGGSVFVQVPSSEQAAAPDIVEFSDDPAWFDDEVGHWMARLDRSVQDALKTLGKPREVLIGGPTAYPRSQATERQTGRIKDFWGDKGFGFILPDQGGAKVFFHISSAQVPDGVALERGLAVEFDIGDGRRGPEAQRVIPVPRLTMWLRQRSFVAPQGLACGARECLLRLDTGSLTWREWLPELSLEVVRDGHFGELPLLERGTFVDPFLGDAAQFTVPESLTLACSHRWFSFPLLVGRQGRRPIAWEARLESPAFPLDRDVRAQLKLSYRYGLDNSYELAVEPESRHDAPFSRIEARWIRGGETASESDSRTALVFGIGEWAPADERDFVGLARQLLKLDDADLERVLQSDPSLPRGSNSDLTWQERMARRLYRVMKRGWAQGRTTSTAGADVGDVLQGLRDGLLSVVDHLPGALNLLALLHEDAPPEVVSRVLEDDENAADDDPAYRRSATMMAMLVGDGMNQRRAVLERLLERLTRLTEPETFNARLAAVTMRALGSAAWRHPGFIETWSSTPAAVTRVLEQCRRSLENLMSRLPLDAASEEEREEVSRRFGTPFRDSCELILALLRVDSSHRSVARLRRGSPSAVAFAKAIRRLDARFAAMGAPVRWRVHLNVDVPSAVHRMSKVAFALNSYLTDGAGANLVRVESADVD